jgi:hypothetical protein
MSAEHGGGERAEELDRRVPADERVSDDRLIEVFGDNGKFLGQLNDRLSLISSSSQGTEMLVRMLNAGEGEKNPDGIVKMILGEADEQIARIKRSNPDTAEREDFAALVEADEQSIALQLQEHQLETSINPWQEKNRKERPSIPHPVDILRAVDELPVANDAIVAVITDISGISLSEEDSPQEFSSDELVTKFQRTKERILKDPESVKFEDLRTIIQAETIDTEKGEASDTFQDAERIKLESLAKSEQALSNLINGGVVDPTSAEGRMLSEYVYGRIIQSVNARDKAETDVDKAFADTGIVFFEALYNKLPN